MLPTSFRYLLMALIWVSFHAQAAVPKNCEEALVLVPRGAEEAISPDGLVKAKLSANGSTVVFLNAQTGGFVSEFATNRPAIQVTWIKQQGGLLLVTFADAPAARGYVLNPDEDPTTVGIDIYDGRTLNKLRTVRLSKGWSDFNGTSSGGKWMALDYKILIDPKGRVVAKIYPDRFKLYSLEPDLRLVFVRELPYKASPKSVLLRLLYAPFYTGFERVQRDISDEVARATPKTSRDQ